MWLAVFMFLVTFSLGVTFENALRKYNMRNMLGYEVGHHKDIVTTTVCLDIHEQKLKLSKKIIVSYMC